jgi:hypothetical protein
MASKLGRWERKRNQEERRTGTKPEMRGIFLTSRMVAKRKRKAAKVAARLMGNTWTHVSGRTDAA